MHNATNSTSVDPLMDLETIMLLNGLVLASVALLIHYGKKYGYCPNGHFTFVQGNIGHMPMIFSTRSDGRILWESDQEAREPELVRAPLLASTNQESVVTTVAENNKYKCSNV